jgi:hypothetical protein
VQPSDHGNAIRAAADTHDQEPAMTNAIAPRIAAAVLAVAASLGGLSGVAHVASRQFAAAEMLAMSQSGEQVASVQHVVVVGRRLA